MFACSFKGCTPLVTNNNPSIQAAQYLINERQVDYSQVCFIINHILLSFCVTMYHCVVPCIIELYAVSYFVQELEKTVRSSTMVKLFAKISSPLNAIWMQWTITNPNETTQFQINYSGISNKGWSKKGQLSATDTLQCQKNAFSHRTNTFLTSKKRITFPLKTVWLVHKCPLFGGSTVMRGVVYCA